MREKADADGKSCSEFIVRRCLDGGTPAAPEPALSARALRRIARSVLGAGGDGTAAADQGRLRGDWNAALDRADRWLDDEAALG